jgi:hypothetical protein
VRVKYDEHRELDVAEDRYRARGYQPPFDKLPWKDESTATDNAEEPVSMQYKGIRYTVRAGIERDQWIVAIHPGEVDMSGKVITGDREQAEALAHSMINKWLAQHQWR